MVDYGEIHCLLGWFSRFTGSPASDDFLHLMKWYNVIFRQTLSINRLLFLFAEIFAQVQRISQRRKREYGLRNDTIYQHQLQLGIQGSWAQYYVV